MSKKLFIDAFYSQFSEFLEQLTQMYPEDKDFPSFSTNLTAMKYMNPMYPIKFVYSEVVEKYKDKIFSRDETFFLNSEQIQESADINIVYKLKSYIQNMTNENKNAVWSYLEIITKITIKILE